MYFGIQTLADPTHRKCYALGKAYVSGDVYVQFQLLLTERLNSISESLINIVVNKVWFVLV